jgi:hypothetical protein
MRLKVYNPGGLSRKRIDDRFDNAIVHRIHYSAADKLMFVTAIDKMMAKEKLFQNQACGILQVRDSQVLRWQANCALLEEAARPEKMSMHEGPVECVDSFTEEPVSFVDEWRGKGILVLRLCLIRKASNLSPVFANKTLCPESGHFSLYGKKWPHPPHGHAHRAAPPPKKCATRQTVSTR